MMLKLATVPIALSVALGCAIPVSVAAEDTAKKQLENMPSGTNQGFQGGNSGTSNANPSGNTNVPPVPAGRAVDSSTGTAGGFSVSPSTGSAGGFDVNKSTTTTPTKRKGTESTK